ncbi:hypothetical protein [Legionella parisiensis]|uniref:Uncharacterized protein n=1 Tax=Legionella parisiensis TaxID=45071 RepID=A0A1E5JSZ3_9GAMM|nr:hypothetical protein [Legionella parisiensis]KTD40314.1 hypothetical protein Lpar_1631 [Legionella parisiensis]OEH47649.1 hypothetical protein lpari_01324 [Legionella parisiensis]STX77254.1 Uncharacterised protein [Legionella parisiensis]
MVGFFNKENKWRAAMQVTNGLFLAMTAYKMFSDPETVWENGFEIAMLALNIVTFSRNDNALTSIGNAALNFTGLGTAYAGATLGCSANSLTENVGNALLHLTNAVTSICYKYEPNQDAPKESLVKAM